ncbi:MAG: class I SAM-dependent methyltransferase [Polyangiaceae bacterium]
MSENDAASAWSHHAETYGTLFAPLTGFIARGLFTAAEKKLKSGSRILDVACGTGALSIPALEWATGASGHVTATDFSEEMVRRTHEALLRSGAPRTAFETRVENGERLTFTDASFDAVFSCFGIFLFSDRVAGFREAGRVLRSGGVFGTTVWKGPAENEMLRAQMAPVMETLPERLRPNPAAPPPRSWVEISEEGALRAEVEGIGLFEDIQIKPFRATFVIGDRERGWFAMQNNPVMGALLRQCTQDELSRIRTRLMQHLDELAGGPELPVYLSSVCNVLIARRR